jgi:FkbM family methyltransferase
MTTVCSAGIGGLGNQLKCLCSALKQVDFDPSRVSVQWSQTPNQVDCQFEDLFVRWPMFVRGQSDPKVIRTWRLLIDDEVPAGFSSCARSFEEEVPATHKYIDFEYERTPQSAIEPYLKAFQVVEKHISEGIVQDVTHFVNEHFAGEGFVGVHIRTWKSDGARKNWFNFDELCNTVLALCAAGHRCFFLCSDDVETTKALRKEIRNYLGDTGLVVSWNHKLEYGVTKNAFVEMLILARSKVFVASMYSTFSEIAWWFGACRQQVFVPVCPLENIKRFSNGEINVYWSLRDTAHLIDDFVGSQCIMDYSRHYRRFFTELSFKSNPKAFMIDVGAHVGLASLPVAVAGFRVIAIEAIPSNARALKLGVLHNGVSERMLVLNAAASEKDGDWLNIFTPNDRTDNASLNPVSANANVRSNVVDSFCVPSISIDSILFDGDNATKWAIEDAVLLKIDVQGAEMAVLKGAANFLRLAQPRGNLTIEMEYDKNLFSHHGTQGRDLIEFILNLGYQVVSPIILADKQEIDEFLKRIGTCDLIIKSRCAV